PRLQTHSLWAEPGGERSPGSQPVEGGEVLRARLLSVVGKEEAADRLARREGQGVLLRTCSRRGQQPALAEPVSELRRAAQCLRTFFEIQRVDEVLDQHQPAYAVVWHRHDNHPTPETGYQTWRYFLVARSR